MPYTPTPTCSFSRLRMHLSVYGRRTLIEQAALMHPPSPSSRQHSYFSLYSPLAALWIPPLGHSPIPLSLFCVTFYAFAIPGISPPCLCTSPPCPSYNTCRFQSLIPRSTPLNPNPTTSQLSRYHLFEGVEDEQLLMLCQRMFTCTYEA